MQFFILTTLLILVFNPTFSYGSKLSYEGKTKLPINDCVPISNTLVGDFRNGDRVTFSDDNCATFLKKGRTSITSCSPTIEFKKPGGWPETILTPSEPGVYQLCFYNEDKISILLEVELETEEYLAFLQQRGVSITTGMDYTTGIDMTTTTTTGVASTTTTTDVSTTAVSTTAVTTTAATTGATVSTTGVPTTDASTTAATTGATVSTTGVPTTDASTTAATTGATVSTTGVPTITTTGATTTTTTSSTTSTSTSTTTSSTSTTSDVTTSTSTTSTTGDATTSTSTTGTTTTTTGSTSTTGSTTGTTNTTIVVVVDTSTPQNVTIPGLSTPITIALPGIANGTASFSAAGPDVSGYVDPSANLPSGGTFLSASFFITIKVDGWPVESFEDNPIMVTLTNPGQTADDDLWLFDVIDNTWVLVTSTCTGGQKSVRIGDQITVPICHLTQFALFRTPALSANTDGGGAVINPVKSSGISSGAIAAAVIVPVLVVLAVLVLVVFLIRKRQSKTKNDDIELASPYARKNTNADQSMSKITVESLTSDAKQKPVVSHTKEETSDEESESETSESESSSDSSDSTSESSSSATSESESDHVEPVKSVIATPKVTPTPPAKTSPVVNRKSVQPEPTVVATAQELITKGPGAKPVTQATLTGASKPKEESSEESESETDESEVEQVRPVAAHEESSEEESSDSESSSSETSSSSESN